MLYILPRGFQTLEILMITPDLLTDLGVKFARHGESPHVTEGWVGTQCPFCGHGPGEARLGINLRTGVCTCWTCGVHRPAETLAALTGKPISECIELLGEFPKTPAARREPKKGVLKLPEPRTPLGPVHRDYLGGRGFDPDLLERLWGLEGTDYRSKVPWSLIIPIRENYRTVSWIARRCSDRDHGRRYVGAGSDEELVSKKSVLYGADHATHAVIVVEGPTDVWAIGPGAVATLGVGYSRSQVERIGRYPVRAVCFDQEIAAQMRAKALAAALEALPGATARVVLECGSDPAGCLKSQAGVRELSEIRKRFLT